MPRLPYKLIYKCHKSCIVITTRTLSTPRPRDSLAAGCALLLIFGLTMCSESSCLGEPWYSDCIWDAVRTTCVRRRLPRNERELTTSGHRKKVIFLALICQQRCERFAKGMFRLTHQSLLVAWAVYSLASLRGESLTTRDYRLSRTRCFSRGVNSGCSLIKLILI